MVGDWTGWITNPEVLGIFALSITLLWMCFLWRLETSGVAYFRVPVFRRDVRCPLRGAQASVFVSARHREIDGEDRYADVLSCSLLIGPSQLGCDRSCLRDMNAERTVVLPQPRAD